MWRSRMMHVLFFEDSERGAWTFRARPLLFDLTASIQYFGWNRRPRIYQSRFVRSFFPHGTENRARPAFDKPVLSSSAKESSATADASEILQRPFARCARPL